MKKGFTLIELLAVIIILAILMIIAVPNILSTLATARERAFVTQAQSIYKTAEQQYLKDSMLGINNVCYDTSNLDLGSYSDSLSYQVTVDTETGKVSSITVTDSSQGFTATGTNANNINMVTYSPGSLDCVGYSGLNKWDGTSEEIMPVGDTYTVTTPQQLAWISNQVNSGANSFEGKTILLGANLDMSAKFNSEGTLLSGHSFTQIGYSKDNEFKGDFDGQNHKIYNLYVNGTGNYVGLIGRHYGTSFKNVTVENSYIKGAACVGIIGGNASVSPTLEINNVKSINNYVIGIYSVGGIIGQAAHGNISNCYSNSTATSNNNTSTNFSQAGGIVGRLAIGSVINSTNAGTVSGNKHHVGGIVGIMTNASVSGNINSISGNTNSGSVLGVGQGVNVGGIVGVGDGEYIISNNVNNGSVTNLFKFTGGIIGGAAALGTVANNINNGTITGEKSWIGGIAGAAQGTSNRFVVISNNINNGEVKTTKGACGVGGIVGDSEEGNLIYNNKNTGSVDGIGDGTSQSYGVGGISGMAGLESNDDQTKRSYIYI